MGERAKYTPGTFSWADLTTTDQDAAKSFYGALFGWSANDIPAGEGVIYSMMQLGGRDVAAISPQQQQQRDAGVPPTWNSYITVESADAAVARATELGGSAHAPAFDVFEAGRMAVLQDPQGAYFMVWEPKQHIGAGIVNAHGALSWNELATSDMDASASFYSDFLGWKTEPFAQSPMPYLFIQTADGHGNGGMRRPQPQEPNYWLVYFGSDDIDATLGKIKELGGTELVGTTDIGVGKIAVAQDPQGAVFALYSGQVEP
jgi:predicted enzyme related to lactoylglutathione lyase